MKKKVSWISDVKENESIYYGNKTYSLAKLMSIDNNINIPNGFAISNIVFSEFLQENKIENQINTILHSIQSDPDNFLFQTSLYEKISSLILTSQFNKNTIKEIKKKYLEMKKKYGNISFAVRSSASGEDSLKLSYAGQQKSFLHIKTFNALLHTIKLIFASLYSMESISYRIKNNITIYNEKMAILIQKMIRSDKSTSGVIFTRETEHNHPDITVINANVGLGESIVQGISNPDEFLVYAPSLSIIQKNRGDKKTKSIYGKQGTILKKTTKKEQISFCLSDTEIIFLSKLANIIETYFGHKSDIEWAKDFFTDTFYIVQVRAITYTENTPQQTKSTIYEIQDKNNSEIIVTGKAIGKHATHGRVCIIETIKNIHQIQPGDILVTHITDPQWEPAMKIASGIITNAGGRTCHAAIIAREMGIPAIVGCHNATEKLKMISEATMSCCEGTTGFVYKNKLTIRKTTLSKNHFYHHTVKNTNIMINLGNPGLAFKSAHLPTHGVGLARIEFIINSTIGIHPNAILHLEKMPKKIQKAIYKKSQEYNTPQGFYIEKLTEGLATIAAAFFPKKVIIRLSDFKTNEYKNLLGGSFFEIEEENPMLGFRGAARYLHKNFSEAFHLEVQALQALIYKMNFTNIAILVPFVRTLEEAEKVTQILEEKGISSKFHTPVYMMCEIPSNALLADQFLNYFDGFSIGSNDMTQLSLGIDRDANNEAINNAFDERNEAVKILLSLAIKACKNKKKYIGICGQGPSDHSDFAAWLIEKEIDSISLNPDTVISFYENIEKIYPIKTEQVHETTQKISLQKEIISSLNI